MIDFNSVGLEAHAVALVGGLAVFLPVLVVWSFFWKGLALWHSGRRGQQWWFIAFLVVNTMGILEIIYLFGVIKLSMSKLFIK